MKDQSNEKKIAAIVFSLIVMPMIAYLTHIDHSMTMVALLWFWMFGYLYGAIRKTKYTFKVWLKILILNIQIKKLKKVAETNLKGKGRDKEFCNPVYTARENLEAKQKELKELVR